MVKYFCLFVFVFLFSSCIEAKEKLQSYSADDDRLQYVGRIDFSNKLKPRMWATAAGVGFSFKGTTCKVIVSDEELYGTSHNYIDIVVDGQYNRIQLSSKTDTLVVALNLKDTVHQVSITKSTEAGIGYIEFDAFLCEELVPTSTALTRKIESFGDSITSGMGNDTSSVGCHRGDWYDQTNGYRTYAAITGRALNAQHHLTSVSGIGMIHSCCDMDVLMPQVFDKISLRDNKLAWDFTRYQPDVVTICLGQNDGVQDSARFCNAYINLVQQLRTHYPKATIICLSSPMADPTLLKAMKKYLTAVRDYFFEAGDKNVYRYYFTKQSIAGCDSHPSMSEHEQIASELTAYIKSVKNW